MNIRLTFKLTLLFLALSTPLLAADRYVLPSGAGAKNGLSFATAYDASGTGLTTAINDVNTAGSGTVFIGSGTYSNTNIAVKGGTSDSARLIIQGVDTGSGLPVFSSTWDKASPGSGPECFVWQTNASYITIDSVNVDHYQYPFDLSTTNSHNTISNVIMHDYRIGFWFENANYCYIANITASNHTKTTYDVRTGCNHYIFYNCTDDAGGVTYATDSYENGFHVGNNGACSDIHFWFCTAANAYDDEGAGYWNGDGFTDESNSTNITYNYCVSHGNTDGGFDCKAGSILTNCVAYDNKRNYRMWGNNALLINCLGHTCHIRGGSGGAGDLWVDVSTVNVHNSTFHNVGASDNANIILTEDADGAPTVNFYDSLITIDSNSGTAGLTSSSGSATINYNGAPYNSFQWKTGVSGVNPQYLNATSNFAGFGTNYDNALYGFLTGYHSGDCGYLKGKNFIGSTAGRNYKHKHIILEPVS